MGRKRSRLLAVFVAAVFIAVGCGKSSPKDNGIAARTPQQILTAVKAALVKAQTFHVSGSGMSGGGTLAVDVSLDAQHMNAVGRITVGNANLQLIRVGSHVYVNTSAALLGLLGLSSRQAQQKAGKWLTASVSDARLGDLLTFVSVDKLLEPAGQVMKGRKTTVQGQKALELVDSKGTAEEATLYVRTTGDPLPIEIKPGGQGAGSFVFNEFGKTVHAVAPAGAIALG